MAYILREGSGSGSGREEWSVGAQEELLLRLPGEAGGPRLGPSTTKTPEASSPMAPQNETLNPGASAVFASELPPLPGSRNLRKALRKKRATPY